MKMKTMNKTIKVFAETVALAAMLSGCAFSMNTEQGTQSSTGGAPNAPGIVGPTAGSENFEAIYLNMLNITGIPRNQTNTNNCQTEWNTQKNAMPTAHDLSTMSAAAQSAVLKVAACVCRLAITNNVNSARTTFTPGFDYTKAGNALTDADYAKLEDGILNAAWGSNVALYPDRTQAKDLLTKLAKDLVSGDPSPTTNASTGRAAYGICTTVLGSVATHVL